MFSWKQSLDSGHAADLISSDSRHNGPQPSKCQPETFSKLHLSNIEFVLLQQMHPYAAWHRTALSRNFSHFPDSTLLRAYMAPAQRGERKPLRLATTMIADRPQHRRTGETGVSSLITGLRLGGSPMTSSTAICYTAVHQHCGRQSHLRVARTSSVVALTGRRRFERSQRLNYHESIICVSSLSDN